MKPELKIKLQQIIKEEYNSIMKESELQDEYNKFFDTLLSKYNVKSPEELSDEKKKSFFNNIETYWKEGEGATEGWEDKITVSENKKTKLHPFQKEALNKFKENKFKLTSLLSELDIQDPKEAYKFIKRAQVYCKENDEEGYKNIMEAFNKYNCDNPEEINWVKLYDQLKPVLQKCKIYEKLKIK